MQKVTIHIVFLCSVFLLITSCSTKHPKGSFGYDLAFFKEHQDIIRLKGNEGKSQLIVSPAFQGRVMTSTANGLQGNSHGWVNYDLIASKKLEEHINVFGGEDRFWIGPEGGQYSIFFKKGAAFDFENWQTPKEIDTEPFDVVEQSESEIVFHKKMQLVNYQDYTFDIEVKRKIGILTKEEIEKDLSIQLSKDLAFVGYQSNNEIINSGTEAWSKETGLLSIWILGMYIPSPNTTVIIPYKDTLALNTSYFGEIPPDKLKVTDKQVLFKGDGALRSKLGLPPKNIIPYIGSYDSDRELLTIVSYTFQGDTTYVNSLWENQDNPYAGDVVNSYNDGPLENGEQLGPFYELESSSSTRALKPQESIKHNHKTFHFEGDFEGMNKISKQLLGKDLNDLR